MAEANYKICIVVNTKYFYNAGDIARLVGTVRSMHTEMPTAKFVVACSDVYSTQRINGLGQTSTSISNISGWIRWFSLVREIDLFVYMVLDYRVSNVLRLLTLRLARRRIMIHTLNFYSTPGQKWLRGLYNLFISRLLVNLADIITVRDESSQEALLRLNAAKKSFLTADPALKIEAIPGVHARRILSQIGISKDIHFIIVVPFSFPIRVPWHPFSEQIIENYRAQLVKIADFIVSEMGQCLFIPFNSILPDDDSKFVRGLVSLMKHKDKVNVFEDWSSPSELVGVIKEADLMLGTRTHALKFAALGSVPTIAISYETKIDDFMKRIGQENLVCHVENFTYEDCISKIEYAWTHREQIRQEMEPRVKELKEKAALNARLAKELLLRSKGKQG